MSLFFWWLLLLLSCCCCCCCYKVIVWWCLLVWRRSVVLCVVVIIIVQKQPRVLHSVDVECMNWPVWIQDRKQWCCWLLLFDKVRIKKYVLVVNCCFLFCLRRGFEVEVFWSLGICGPSCVSQVSPHSLSLGNSEVSLLVMFLLLFVWLVGWFGFGLHWHRSKSTQFAHLYLTPTMGFIPQMSHTYPVCTACGCPSVCVSMFVYSLFFIVFCFCFLNL